MADALARVGELLEADGNTYRVLIVGGAALNLLGIVNRVTTDVDIIAFGTARGIEPPPVELPDDLLRAARRVAQDLRLAPDWLNTGPASQWTQGLPPGLGDRLVWRRFGGLEVGLPNRLALICLKLHAAVDSGPGGVHYADLLALQPTPSELIEARAWVETQDASPEFRRFVEEVVHRVERDLERAR